MSLSIIECISPITARDIGARLEVTLQDNETFVCTVQPMFPLKILVGFEIMFDEATSGLQARISKYTAESDIVSTHLAAVEKFALELYDKSDETIHEMFEYVSYADFRSWQAQHTERVMNENRTPLYLLGTYGRNLITCDDNLDASVAVPATIPLLELGTVQTLHTFNS